MTSLGTASGPPLSAGYDPSGLRAWKQSSQTGGGKVYTFYDGGDPLAEANASGSLVAVNTFAGGLLSRQAGGTGASGTTLYTFDPKGNVAQRVGASGSVQSTDHYNASGQLLGSSSGDEFGFGGQAGYRTDPETGLCLLGQRYYDPGAGRFLTRDPAGYAGGLDLYAYTGDDPVNEMDPSGLGPNDPLWEQPFEVLWGMGKNVLQTAASMSLPGQVMGQVQMAQAIQEYGVGAAGCMMLSGIAHAFTDFATTSDPERFGESFSNLLMLLPSDGESAEGELAAAAARGGCGTCLVAGTPVWLADGSQEPIEDIRVGQQVLSRDPQTGQDEVKTVTATVQRPADALVTLSLSDPQSGKTEALTCTPEHPLYVVGQGWVEAGDLGIGTSFVTRAGPPVVVKDLQWQRDQTGQHPFTVYNLTVQGDHTYFAGSLDGGVWAHNSCVPETWGNPKTLGTHYADKGAGVGATSPEDYANKASQFLQESQANGYEITVDGDGILQTYDPSTNTFGAYNADGTTRTFFKPEGSPGSYWNSVKQRGWSPVILGDPVDPLEGFR